MHFIHFPISEVEHDNLMRIKKYHSMFMGVNMTPKKLFQRALGEELKMVNDDWENRELEISK